MAALNKIILIGRLTSDPEIRYTPNGAPVASFTLAVDRKFSKNDETDFIPVVAWRKLAEICGEYLHKGKLVAIDGRLQTRSYEDKDGNRRKSFDVVADEMQMLDRSDKGGGGGGQSRSAPAASSSAPRSAPAQQRSAAPPPGPPGGGAGGGFPPSDPNLGIDDIPF